MSALAATPSTVAEPTPGAYRFEVGSAAEAVETIRRRLGPDARVISVRPCTRSGLARLWSSPRYEVVAELPPPPAPTLPPPGLDPAPPAALAIADGRRLPSLLRRAGFPEPLLGRLETSPGWTRALGLPLHAALADLARDLRAAARPARPLPARAAFLGGAGCGRTTALCKRLAREVVDHGRPGAVWRVEFSRPNPAPTLDIFCEAMGVPVDHYSPGLSAPREGFLFADLPALPAPGTADDRALRGFLDAERITGRVLVLNAAYETDALREAYARGVALGATHLVFTHLDETPRWGRLWEYLVEGELAPLFLSTGPALAGDLEDDVTHALLARTLPIRKEEAGR